MKVFIARLKQEPVWCLLFIFAATLAFQGLLAADKPDFIPITSDVLRVIVTRPPIPLFATAQLHARWLLGLGTGWGIYVLFGGEVLFASACWWRLCARNSRPVRNARASSFIFRSRPCG